MREQLQARRGVPALRKRHRPLDAEAERRRERVEGLRAAEIGARDEPRDSAVPELIDEPERLALSAFAQRSKTVVAGPRIAVAGMRVSHEERGGAGYARSFAAFAAMVG